MSLDLGGGVSEHAEPNAAQVEEEDYCQFSAQRFQAQWAQQGVFAPAVLRHYAVRGELSLPRSLSQVRSFSATFGFFPLGRVPFSMLSPLQMSQLWQAGVDPAAMDVNVVATAKDDIPFAALAFGQYADGRLIEPEANRTREHLLKFFGSLQAPSGWAREQCGVVTVPTWDGDDARAAIDEQLQLASFLGVQAVLVSLPCLSPTIALPSGEACCVDPQWTSTPPPAAAELSVEQRQIALLCKAADSLRKFINGGFGQKVWVSCDVCVPSQRRWYQLLLRALCYGYDVDEVTGVHVVRAPDTAHAMSQLHNETLMRLSVYLYCSDPESLLTVNGQLLSAAWLGEDVVAFEVPPATLLRDRLLSPPVAPGGQEVRQPTSVPRDADISVPPSLGSGSNDSYLNGGSVRSEPAHALDESGYHSFLNDSWGSAGRSSPTAPVQEEQADDKEAAARVAAEPSDTAAPVTTAALVYRLPSDVPPSSQSRWCGVYGPHARMGLIAFIVELLRRRAAPVFRDFFFDHYSLLNYLYFKAVVDVPRDMFLGFEDALQLPLQPLGHQLSSGVYEVFERDASKYSAYRDAFYAFVCDWLNAGSSRWHITANAHIAAPSTIARSNDPTLHVVLLGCGRGPLIDECLSAASSLGVRVRLFAIEKNPPAAAFTRMRAAVDPEWAHLSRTFGHSIEVITANGRTIFDNRAALGLPSDFGLCDVVVSELLGSFGDNELSPECLEGFHGQLRQLQEANGITANPFMVSIPESYTAWVAPLHSVRVEQAVAEASIKGFTVRPDNCHDPHAALYHSYYVCNTNRGALLAPPQRCWTFEHRWSKASGDAAAPPPIGLGAFERSAALRFTVSPQARCSALIGFFNAVLYTPAPSVADVLVEREPIELSTLPETRTKDMYSWFPCVFALAPSEARELSPTAWSDATVENSKSTAVSIHVRMQRRRELHRAWYTWQVVYGDNPASFSDATVMNEEGWASTIRV